MGGGVLPSPYDLAHMPLMSSDIDASKVTGDDIALIRERWEADDELIQALRDDFLVGVWKADDFVTALVRPSTYSARATEELRSLLSAWRKLSTIDAESFVRGLRWLRADYFGRPFAVDDEGEDDEGDPEDDADPVGLPRDSSLTEDEVESLLALARERHPALLEMQAEAGAEDMSCVSFIRTLIDHVAGTPDELNLKKMVAMDRIQKQYGEDPERALVEMGKIPGLTEAEKLRNAEVLDEVRHWKRVTKSATRSGCPLSVLALALVLHAGARSIQRWRH